jgi:hypothetical protein
MNEYFYTPTQNANRNKGGFAHNTGYKTRARSNRTGQTTGIEEPAIEKRMRQLIGAK